VTAFHYRVLATGHKFRHVGSWWTLDFPSDKKPESPIYVSDIHGVTERLSVSVYDMPNEDAYLGEAKEVGYD